MKYTITNIEETPGGLHVEYEYKIEEDTIKEQINFGSDYINNEKWKKHLEQYLKRKEEDLAKPKKDFKQYKGKHDTNGI